MLLRLTLAYNANARTWFSPRAAIHIFSAKDLFRLGIPACVSALDGVQINNIKGVQVLIEKLDQLASPALVGKAFSEFSISYATSKALCRLSQILQSPLRHRWTTFPLSDLGNRPVELAPRFRVASA